MLTLFFFTGVFKMNENVANDALCAFILVEPVQGSQHTYSVEVKKC